MIEAPPPKQTVVSSSLKVIYRQGIWLNSELSFVPEIFDRRNWHLPRYRKKMYRVTKFILSWSCKARFKRRATAVPNSIDRIKFDLSTAVARLGFKRRATAVPNSIRKL